jgi:REP element-mobilizing transposase RayT
LPNVARHNEPVIVFLTACAKDHRAALANATMHKLLVKAWGLAQHWIVGRYIVMPDHVHLFCSPAVHEAENVKIWAAYWKGLVSRGMRGYGLLAADGVAAVPPGAASGGRGATRAVEDGYDREGAVPPASHQRTAAPADGPPADGVAAVPPGNASGGRGATRAAEGDTLWQRDVWDTQLRSGVHYAEKWDYVRCNPVRKELVHAPDEWPFQGELNVLRW